MTKSEGFVRFSNIQWYLAHADNTVHFIAASRRELTEDQLHFIVDEVLREAPQLCQHESAIQDGHIPADDIPVAQIASFRKTDSPVPPIAAILETMGQPFADTGEPTFRARLHTSASANAEGIRSILAIESTHAVMEGGDIANLLRGRSADHLSRPVVNRRPKMLARWLIKALSVPLALIHVTIAKTEKKDAADFRFASTLLDRNDVWHTARAIGVSQQALLFSLVLYATRPEPAAGKALNVIYSTLPAERSRVADDAYLNVRLQEVKFRGAEGFEAFARATQETIKDTRETPYFTMSLYNHLIGVHRVLHKAMPWLYRGNFFGFSPADFILSMLPPARAVRKFSMLEDATIFAGSLTKTARNCIFVPGEKEVSLNFWADKETLARLPELHDLAESLFARHRPSAASGHGRGRRRRMAAE